MIADAQAIDLVSGAWHVRLRIFAWYLAAAVVLNCGGVSANEPDDGFFKGKTISLVIATPPGGGYDIAGRLLARYLGRYIPGNPSVVPQNMPGAGGFRAANFLASAAPRDGLTIAVHTRGVIQAPILGNPAAHFDSADFSWIGTISSSKNDAYLLIVNKKSGIRSVEDMQKAKTPVSLGSVGGITSNVIFALLSPRLFGFNIRTITGYPGSAEIMLAVSRGEVDGAYIGLPALTGVYGDYLKKGELVPILQLARTTPHPNYPTVPLAMDLTKDSESKALLAFNESIFQLALPVSGPPGLPENRRQALRAAFMKATSDPGYLADANKLAIDTSALDGENVTNIILEMKQTPPAVIQFYKDTMAKHEKK